MKDKQHIIDDIRAFNRYYTGLLGLLNNHLLDSDYSLAEARILYEIHSLQPVSASQIMSNIVIDKGYLSRVLKQFEKSGLISKQVSSEDARITLVSLTATGLTLFNKLNAASEQQIATLLNKLSSKEQQQLVGHMQAIRTLLSD
ncbi:MarR family winged helix-turn-helix transcriptional regulator [Cytophagaceae bacterium DM2B3-1]|uniref:MarR family winged helix-turn-helix transcriptional regulator n=1 Tax=Xanthocytophaga flava TaxID=3048013 RepID=A0ABT7CM01_9BACT|nr:MarR family winged helix-turn-helix transcriptional regulator [Xanthocytophaga flavus]MDJ1494771.1 MarR family winged helix-turn-helix transcriptional regulator [Xanthocytophaga flavus]